MNNEKREDRVVVVTGATKGLGRSLSLAFAQAGYHVIGLYRSDTSSAEFVESEFRSARLSGTFIQQDITKDGEWPLFDEAIKARQGSRFTFLANASAPFTPRPLHLVGWAEISRLLEVNVKGTQSVLDRLLPAMVKARRGTIITILSSALSIPPKGFSAYLTAKSALEGFTRVAAAEYAERGIRVFSVSPGFMQTPMTDGWSEHLRASVRGAGGPADATDDVAQRILALAEGHEVKGHGENYLLDHAEDSVAAKS